MFARVQIIVALLMVLILSAGAAHVVAATPVSTSAPAADDRPGWKLVWSDEFDKDGLPDPKKWTYEKGFVRNHEKQYYTKERKENARVENGVLVIEGRKENYREGKAQADYTSASLTTQGIASWTRGRIEARAKLPHGKGVWPAFWTLGTDIPKVGWPKCGEIDIMEFVGHTPDKVHATVHYSHDGKHASQGSKLTVDKPWEAFHVYAVEWDDQTIDFYFDDTKYFTFKIPDADVEGKNPFRNPHYLILNLALGGEWGGKIDDTMLPQRFEIDYVRVYQKAQSQTKP